MSKGRQQMDKQPLINSITTKLNSMGISCAVGAGADITVDTEFLDAQWGTGQKKIEYHASALLNESENTLYFWEFTKETGSGFSFGSSSESSFQSGVTLFRKVKSIQFGPDGKAYEYSLDLGAITKTFKGIAKQSGWKFKVVLKRDKASYPPGYTYQTPIPIQIQPQTAQPPASAPEVAAQLSPPQAAYSAQPSMNIDKPFQVQMPDQENKKAGALFWTPFSILLLVSVVFFLGANMPFIGWGVLATVFILLYIYRSKLAGAGVLVNIAVWLAALIILFFTMGLAA